MPSRPAHPRQAGLYAYPEGTYPPGYGPFGYADAYSDGYPPEYDPAAALQP